jgi:hypothetical protein
LHIRAARQVLRDLLPVLLVVLGHGVRQNQVFVLSPVALRAAILVLSGPDLVQMRVFLLSLDNGLNCY